MKEQSQDLHNMRHSCAHLLAAAVQELWPDVKLGVGPVIEDGLYYDFDLKHRLTEEDFPSIEKKMAEIAAQGHSYEREEVDLDKAKERVKEMEQPYKLELIEAIEKTGSTAVMEAEEQNEEVGQVDKVSFYTTGKFVDLCRGGHCPTTKDIGPFKLLSVAGAYWRGSEDNPMMQRIYVTCWPTQEELDKYLELKEEAKKRDHRKLGKELDLFTFSDLVGAGLPLFTAKGNIVRQQITAFVQSLMHPYGYQQVWTPHITKVELYKTSGHYDKFSDDIFYARSGREEESEFALKPMNCPHHTQIYASQPRSYRDLPIRLAEVGTVYRDELSGELGGLTRVRSLSIDDAHLFCRPDQVGQEVRNLYGIIKDFYSIFDMELRVRLSVRDPKAPEKYLGTDEIWEKSEAELLKVVMEEVGEDFVRAEGEAAFYGPKIDFISMDSLGREWQLATIQVDFNQPERFGLEYTADDGSKQQPVMVHRAILGSLERFIGVLIEHFAGKFPFWLAPTQVKILPIADKHLSYAESVKERLHDAGFHRVEIDTHGDMVGKKIKKAQLEKVPYMLIVGDKEVESGLVAIRHRDEGDQGTVGVEELIKKLKEEINPIK